MSVAEILGQKGRAVFTTQSDTSLEEVAKVLAERKIGATVVLDKAGKVCGIASERDIIRRLAKSGVASLKEPVANCMTKDVISCDTQDTVDSVMEKMTHGRFRHLPVIEKGELCGIISIGDVVKLKIQQSERDAEELKRYIAG